eukprot:256096-Chlamydomonas_euryale.AAC.15
MPSTRACGRRTPCRCPPSWLLFTLIHTPKHCRPSPLAEEFDAKYASVRQAQAMLKQREAELAGMDPKERDAVVARLYRSIVQLTHFERGRNLSRAASAMPASTRMSLDSRALFPSASGDPRTLR